MTDLKEKIGARLRTEDLHLIKKVCKARGETPSTFVRRALRRELGRLSFLSAMEKKALQIAVEEVKINEAI